MKLNIKKYIFLSFLFHGLCFLIYMDFFLNYSHKVRFLPPKHHSVIDVYLVENTKLQKKQIIVKTIIQKPIPKTPKHILQQKPVLQQAVQPIENVKKIIHIKTPVSIPFVGDNKIQEKPVLKNYSVGLQKISTNTADNIYNENNNIAADSFNKSNYIAYVKQRIANHKFYPNTAKRRGIEGRVGFKISIKSTGDIDALDMIQSSGSDILDQAALQAVRQASPFKPPHKKIQFSFGIQYNLQ